MNDDGMAGVLILLSVMTAYAKTGTDRCKMILQ
jgi:hypothetical protein